MSSGEAHAVEAEVRHLLMPREEAEEEDAEASAEESHSLDAGEEIEEEEE